MNNATFFRDGRRLKLAYDKYRDAAKDIIKLDLASFACYSASTAFWYDIGQIVQWPDGRFGTVDGYSKHEVGDDDRFCCIHVTGDANGWWRVEEGKPDEFNAKIPKGLLDLAKSQLQANCPLKEAKCQV